MINRRQWTKCTAGYFAASTAMATLPGIARSETIEFTFSVWLPPTHSLVANFTLPWVKQIERATEGRVRVKVLPKPVTNAAGHYDAVRNGVVDFAFISQAYYPGRFSLAKFSILPFSGNSALATSIAGWRIYNRYLKANEEHKGVKLLATYNHGPGAVFTNGRKVQKIADFEGLRIRLGGGMAADVAKLLGVDAVVKPAPESYELMSTGVVDGVFFPPEAITAFRLETIIKEATLFPGGLYSDMHSVIMNERSFSRLSGADRNALLKISGEHIARLAGAAWGAADKAGLKALKERKIHFNEADEQLVKDIRERTAPLTAQWLKAASEHGIDGPKVLEAFQEELRILESS